MNFCSIGHVALDLIDQKKQPGGSVLFDSYLAQNLGNKCSVVTSSSVDFPYVDYSDIEWSIQFSVQTTLFQHEYKNGKRDSSLLQQAQVIQNQSIPKSLKNADAVMITPILNEVTPEILNMFSTPWLALTPQGWFREIDQDGKISFSKSKFRALPKKIKLIVVSQDDLQNDQQSWDWICEFAEVAVQTMGAQGYLLNTQGQQKKYEPTQVFKEINPTGCGDIFSTAVFLALYQGIDPIQACAWAGYAAGLASTQSDIAGSIRVAAEFLKSKF